MQSLSCSRYTVVVQLLRGRVLAYNGLSGALAVWEDADRRAWEDIQSGRTVNPEDPSVQALLYGGFVVDTVIDELAVLEEQYDAHRFNPRMFILTVAPTLACNFGCDYCFQGKDKPSETMGQRVQDAVVRYVEQSLPFSDRVHIAWYGGEPLLRPQVIEALSDRIIPLCDARRVHYDAMIVTNGYRLTVDTAEMLLARRVKAAQITIDGNAGYHDSRRYLLSGGSTYGRIVENLRAVVSATRLDVRVRVNIDHRNAAQITALLDDLVGAGLANKPNLKVYFAPIEAMTAGCHSVEKVCMSKSDYGQLEAQLYRYGHQKGLTVLPYPPRFHGTCAAVRPTGFVVTPTGAVHKCWDTVTFPRHAIGTIFEPDSLAESDLAQRWMRWTPFENDSCRNCRILPNCAGACAYKFVHTGETRGEAATLPCPSWKYNIKERLILRAEAQGAITADDYDPAMIRTNPAELCTERHVPGGQLLPAA